MRIPPRRYPARNYQRGAYVIMGCMTCKIWFRWHRVRKGVTPATYITHENHAAWGRCNNCIESNKLLGSLRDAVKSAIAIVKVAN